MKISLRPLLAAGLLGPLLLPAQDIPPDNFYIWTANFEARELLRTTTPLGLLDQIFPPLTPVGPTPEPDPNSLALFSDGGAFVSTANDSIYRMAPAGNFSKVNTTGAPIRFPHGLAIGPDGFLYVANFSNNTVTRVNLVTLVSTVFVSTGLSGPNGLAFDRAGNLYVSNSNNNTITKVTPAGVGSVFVSATGNGLSRPWGLAFDADGILFVANNANNTVTRYTADGVPAGVITGFSSPRGVALDTSGSLYVANYGNNTISRRSQAGVTTVFSSPSLRGPTGLALADRNGVPLPLPPAATPPPPPPPAPNPGRLTNLSIRSTAGTGAQTLIMGTVIGGAGTSGTKPLLIRGIGPALTGFGVPGVLADPILNVFAGANVVATNDNWGGDAQVAAIGNAVGAFALAPPTSRDAALYAPALAARDYSIQITGAGGATGVALAELYDATPAGTFSATTPQLVNVSARTQVGTGADILIAGFTLGGTTARTVLIRAVGPTLTGFGVPGALADPQLALFSGTNQLQQNNDWGTAANAAQVTATTTQLGTFQLGAGSRDSAILANLQPGSYTAQISGVGGTTGVALVEIYVVP